jgi:hypothetical protein
MKKLIVLALLALAAGHYPQFAEGTNNNCAAVEQKIMRQVEAQNDAKGYANASELAGATTGMMAAKGLVALSDGRFAAEKARQALPNVPVSIACALAYVAAK